MAHNIANIGGSAAIAYQGETPWHQLGTRITPEAAASIPEVMKLAKLDYTVALEPLYLKNGTVVSNRKAVVRDGDVVLGTVSSWYKPIQNRDAFGIFEEAAAEFGMTVECAGALGQGEKAWMLFKLPVDLEPVAGDRINGYGVAITGHNGSTVLEFRPTPIRVVCQNTLNAAVGAGGTKGRVFSIPHIGNVKSEIKTAKRIVTDVIATMRETGDTFAQLAARQMTPADVIAYIETVFPAAKDGKVTDQLAERRKTVAELVWSGVGAEMAGSNEHGTTAWAAYNAVTEYFDHVLTGAAKSGSSKTKANSSALFGTGADVKLSALQVARELVAA